MQSEPLVRARRPMDLRVSYHEAGHSVVAVSRQLPIEFVQIRLDFARASLGSLRWRPEDGAAPARDIVVMLLAGGEAERRACGFITHDGDAGDIEQARAVLAQVSIVAEHVDAALAICRDDAAADVQRLWPAITTVATALRRERVLDAAQIAHLMKGTHP